MSFFQVGGSLKDSYLDTGFILNKRIGVGQPKRIENARILIANTPMDTDKIKIYGVFRLQRETQTFFSIRTNEI